jgi:hypothetical protein
MKRVTVIIATQAKSMTEFENRPIFKSLQRLTEINDLINPGKFNFIIVKNNKRGLPAVYNEYLLKPEHKKDILLFVHDDVELDDMFLVEKLNNSPYPVTGLAGSKSADLTRPSGWHLMSDRGDWVGEVAHAELINNQTKIWTTIFGPTNSRALLIDGLFIAVNVKEVTEQNVTFDENFEFHHYDLSFCLRCNANKIKVGVLPIRVVHHGLGDSMNTPEWQASAKTFSRIYGDKTA